MCFWIEASFLLPCHPSRWLVNIWSRVGTCWSTQNAAFEMMLSSTGFLCGVVQSSRMCWADMPSVESLFERRSTPNDRRRRCRQEKRATTNNTKRSNWPMRAIEFKLFRPRHKSEEMMSASFSDAGGTRKRKSLWHAFRWVFLQYNLTQAGSCKFPVEWNSGRKINTTNTRN